ncbi:hypothetical protein AB3S75_041023 [Citrus x aurantiifolia]
MTLHKRIAVQIEPLVQRKYTSRISISSIEGGLLQIILTMNDLMTRSFLIYVELKKQAMKDEESLPDLEIGTQLYAVDGQNLSQFFEEVAAIKD